jgi:hypothetical protein
MCSSPLRLAWRTRIALLFALLFTSTRAHADPAVALDPATITRDAPLPAGNPAPSINRADCTTNVHYTFPLTLSGLPADGARLQAWAGVAGMDCSLAASRTGAAPSCWPLLAEDIDTSKSTPVVAISSRQLVAQLALATKTAFKDAAGTDAVCRDVAMPQAPTGVSVWFLFVDAAGAPVGAAVKYVIMVDVHAPAAPTGVKASTSNGALIVDFTSSKESDTAGYTIYCAPAASSADAGATDGGAGACQSVAFGTGDAGASALDSGASAGAIDPALICGRIEGNGASGLADHLMNGATYAVVVAASDRYGNLGSPSSPAACGSPQETADFWDAYREHGGLAGGGFCGVGPLGATPGSAPALLAGGTVALALVVKRRRRRRGSGSASVK